MLAEERFSKILSIIESEGSATMQELMTALDASESNDPERFEYDG